MEKYGDRLESINNPDSYVAEEQDEKHQKTSKKHFKKNNAGRREK